MNKQTIIISCGGTGGHIFPAIEIAKSLSDLDSSLHILFIGALNKMEMTTVPKKGFPIIGLWIQGFYRTSIIKNIFLPIKLLISLIQALILLLYYRPVAVIGTGGFASGPVLFIASLLKYKTYIQEQNSYPGLTNKLLSKRVDKIFVSNNNMSRFFPHNKITNLGNPVRHSLKTELGFKFLKKSRDFFNLSEGKFTILIIGGSLGAAPINNAIYNHFNILMQKNYQLIWQTGTRDYAKYLNLKSNNCSIHKFIERMDLAYAASDLVISRAGAIAISEISFLSKPSILIPSPHVTDDHQLENAKYLQKNHACMLVLEEDLMSDKLPQEIENFTNEAIRNKIGRQANALFSYNAANNIATSILNDLKC